MHTVEFEPYSQEFAADPYPVYARLRAHTPIFRTDTYDLTFFSRYRDITKLLTDRRLGRSQDQLLSVDELERRRNSQQWQRLPSYSRYVRLNLLETEGAAHGRLRRLINKAFTPVRAQAMSGKIQNLVDELLQQLAPRGEMDFINELAIPLPVFVIAELLGWPSEQRHRLRPWSANIVRLYEKNSTPEDEALAESAVAEFSSMLDELVSDRRSAPETDLISALVHVEDDGEKLSNDELISTCMMLLNAGHESTVNAAGNGLLALLRHPQQMQRLQNHPSMTSSAVEEILRYDSPLHLFHRIVLEDMTYADFAFRKGDMVGLLYGSANRDGEAFDNADDFDISRNPNPHVCLWQGQTFLSRSAARAFGTRHPVRYLIALPARFAAR